MPYCSACGQEVEPQWNACPNCGHELPEEPPVRQGTPEPSQPQRQTATASGTEYSSGWPLGRKVVVVAAVLGAIAAFLPWITVDVAAGSASVSGIDGGAGLETLVIAALGFAITAWRWGPWQRRVVTGIGGLFIVYTYIFTTDPLFGVEDPPAAALQYEQAFQAGIGLYLMGAAGIVIISSTVYDTFFNDDFSRYVTDDADSIKRPSEQREEQGGSSQQLGNPLAGHANTPEEQAAARAVLNEFSSNDVVTVWGLQNQVYPDHPAGYASTDEWWNEFVKPLLQDHPNIIQYDDSGARWEREN